MPFISHKDSYRKLKNMSKQVSKKYLKRLKTISDDKTLTPIEIYTLQTLATVEENKLNFETAYKDIKKSKRGIKL